MLLDDYTLTKVLGKGTFGDVLFTQKKGSNISYATKRIDRELAEHPQYCKYFVNEVTILRNIYHNNIVKVIDLKKTKNHYYIIMELCNGGSLKENLDKYKIKYNQPFSEQIVQHIMRQIVNAVNYLHGIKIVHRDLKLENILVNFNCEIDKKNINLLNSNIKLVDFGFATHISNAKLLKTAIGSPFNMDPRILKKFGKRTNELLEYDEKADIWSLGSLCYKMLVGENPFSAKDIQELVLKVEEGTLKVPLVFARETISFLLGMLQYDESKRLSSKELSDHPFLIKYIGDFSYIDLRQATDKIRYEDLYIIIKNNENISSIVNIINKNGEKKFNIMTSDLFPSEIGTKFLTNIWKNKEKNNEINSGTMPLNRYTGYYSSINNIKNKFNNRLSIEEGDKYSLSRVEMINSTPMPISTIVSNDIDNLKRKDKDPVKNKLDIKISKNEKSILNSLIEINEKESNLSKSAQQLGLSQQIQQNNNNQKNLNSKASPYPETESKINFNAYNQVINNTPHKNRFSFENKNIIQKPFLNRVNNSQGFNSNKEFSLLNTNINKEPFKCYKNNQNQMKYNERQYNIK